VDCGERAGVPHRQLADDQAPANYDRALKGVAAWWLGDAMTIGEGASEISHRLGLPTGDKPSFDCLSHPPPGRLGRVDGYGFRDELNDPSAVSAKQDPYLNFEMAL